LERRALLGRLWKKTPHGFEITLDEKIVEQKGNLSFSKFFTVAALCERRFRRSQTAATIKLIHYQQNKLEKRRTIYFLKRRQPRAEKSKKSLTKFAAYPACSAAFVSSACLAKLFDSLLRLGQAGSGMLFPVKSDGGDLLLRVCGHKLKLRRQIGQRWRRHFDALMFEERVQFLLQHFDLHLQLQQVNLRVFGTADKAGKGAQNQHNDAVVTELQSCKPWCHIHIFPFLFMVVVSWCVRLLANVEMPRLRDTANSRREPR
jgi:hypothetical protein